MSTIATRGRRAEGTITDDKDLEVILTQAIHDHESPEIAILHLIDKYNFPLSVLESALVSKGLHVNFSRVKYRDVAPFVGLDPARKLKDLGTFELHRSRIPTSLFNDIIRSMDILLKQYGPLRQHKTEEATSRFLSPIINHLVAQFGFAFTNLPESMIELGCIARNERIEYYLMAFGSISILVVEFKLRVENHDAGLDAIGQVIAECDACDWTNLLQNFSVPVIGILWNGTEFQFFKFDSGTQKPYSFLRGALPGDPRQFRQGFPLGDFTITDTSFPFIKSLRQISEILFDLLLCSYISSIDAFRDRSLSHARKKGGSLGASLDKWEDALKFARKALDHCRDADKKRMLADINGANEAALWGQENLTKSLEAVPILGDDVEIMSGWDDMNVEVV